MIRCILLFAAIILLWEQSSGQISADVRHSESPETRQQLNLDRHDLITPVLQRKFDYSNSNEPEIHGMTKSGGLVFLSSAVIPGSGQVMNKNWIKAGIFVALEAVSIYYTADFTNKGKRGERRYENWADENWSVVQYSNWLIDYHDVNGLNNPYIDQLRETVDGTTASFNPDSDWQKIDLTILRNTERNTPYLTTDDAVVRNFSHTLPDYGSQQYYELISKYYQYQAGWKDYNSFHDNLGHTGSAYSERYLIDRNGAYASPLFFEGVDRAHQFNDDYRTGRNILSLLIVNHVISAFDAYFTLKIRQNRIEASPGVSPGQQIKLSLNF